MADEKGGMGAMFGPKKEGAAAPGAGGALGSFGGMLGKHAPAGPSPSQIADVSNQIGNLSRRLRMIEERYTTIRNKTQMTDQNMLQTHKDMSRSLKATNDELLELKREFMDLKDKVKLIVKELKDTADSDDLKTLQKYVELWEPINFVTKEQVKRLIQDAVEEKIEELSQQMMPSNKNRK